MGSSKKVWTAFVVVVVLSFSVLGYYGYQIYMEAPPIPDRVVTATGDVVFTGDDIREGQQVWQSIGGHELGSVWGHGAYVAPDWSADWLHRELVAMLDLMAVDAHGRGYESLTAPEQAALREVLRIDVRTNGYDPESGDLTIPVVRAEAAGHVAKHYEALFGDDPSLDDLREDYAMRKPTVEDPARRASLQAFFFWTSWACSTERPGTGITYTNNWPAEDLIDNRPTSSIFIWSVISILGLLAGIGVLAWYMAAGRKEEELPAPDKDPLFGLQPTPSMLATVKYFWVVAALMVVQIIVGIITAHYGVEGQAFFGIELSKWLPYSVARTWHVQLGIFWIATAWLATGLFVAPAVSGKEPPFQRLGVNVLFGALLVIVVGSLTGEWLGVMQLLDLDTNFWFGHQGYEYVDLGRFWQIFLFVGLFIWLFLLVRALLPALRNDKEGGPLLRLFTVASAAIALFYGAGLMWGSHTVLSVVEYWRWWVVHLWVEGFFEVFATVVVAFLFSRMGLVRASTAGKAAIFSSTIYLTGGIIGTMHHLYFAGTPTGVLAWGAVFSALEIVPLVLVGFEAVQNLRESRAAAWVSHYRWPIFFFVAVAFWNLVGAGLFGFLINPPLALYYMQGLNLTPLHGHTALFGVYGMLGIGLMLFCLRAMNTRVIWSSKVLRFSFWSLNIGLALMALISLLPIGLFQTAAAVQHGLWFARSAEFMQQDFIQNLRWMRVIGDVIFALGMVGIGAFIVGLKTGWSVVGTRQEG
jgi:nitric oxide reductase subunit B